MIKLNCVSYLLLVIASMLQHINGDIRGLKLSAAHVQTYKHCANNKSNKWSTGVISITSRLIRYQKGYVE